MSEPRGITQAGATAAPGPATTASMPGMDTSTAIPGMTALRRSPRAGTAIAINRRERLLSPLVAAETTPHSWLSKL